MLTLLQSKSSPLTPEQWEASFVQAIRDDLRRHDDLLISKLLADADTLHHVVHHVHRYVTDFWKEANEDRSLFGAEIRQKLPSSVAGQKTTIGILETLIARYREQDLSAPGIDLRQTLRHGP